MTLEKGAIAAVHPRIICFAIGVVFGALAGGALWWILHNAHATAGLVGLSMAISAAYRVVFKRRYGRSRVPFTARIIAEQERFMAALHRTWGYDLRVLRGGSGAGLIVGALLSLFGLTVWTYGDGRPFVW